MAKIKPASVPDFIFISAIFRDGEDQYQASMPDYS
jgi:hypothetical protein